MLSPNFNLKNFAWNFILKLFINKLIVYINIKLFLYNKINIISIFIDFDYFLKPK